MFLRVKFLIGLLVILLAVFSYTVPANAEPYNNLNPSYVTFLTNKERESRDLAPLIESETLNQVAEMKAQDMARKGYFAHVSPKGLTPWYWFKFLNYEYDHAGENLGMDFRNAKELAKAWMKSPTHKANIISQKYTEIGTGIAMGHYKGKKVVFVVQVYGNPL